ncbi:MAG: DUF4159 domain-containing protein [Tepidisphaerales bacterium]
MSYPLALVYTRRMLAAMCLVAVFLSSAPARGATPEEVEASIERCVRFLYGQQKAGTWEAVPQRDPAAARFDARGWQWGGATALATCALLAAGQDPHDARLKPAIDFLLKEQIVGTYAMGFKCQVWAMLPATPEVRNAARRDLQTLMQGIRKDGPGRGLYTYYPGEPGTWYDHSASQYGVLGLWACQRLALEIPTGFWEEIDKAWRNHQYATGAWSYRHSNDEANGDATTQTLSMTAAGVATLFITDDAIHAMDGLKCAGSISDENIERGLHWIGSRFRDFEKANTCYTLYGIERIGTASGYKYLGGLDWYQTGAEFLVRRQSPDGWWGGNLPDTCFSLMFLARGRAPVMMNKLRYTVSAGGSKRLDSWNERPRDVANITAWVGRQMERDLNWQIVELQADVADFHDAPILWISGKDTLKFTAAEEAKFKQFIEEGGLIVGHADCASAAFASTFKQLGQKLFPYEFRELPAGHVIFTHQQFRRSLWRSTPIVFGLSNGVRELMLLIPTADPGRGWQTGSFAGPSREPLAQLMADVFQYSVDRKNLRVKGAGQVVRSDAGAAPAQSIRVARLEYAGNWDPEPGGWRRLAGVLRSEGGVQLVVERVRLGKGVLARGQYALAHLTGTAAFTLTESERKELLDYVRGGGTLLVDAAGGHDEFGLAAERQIHSLFAESKLDLRPLPADHAIFKAGDALGQVEYREFARELVGGIRSPRLLGIEDQGRAAVIFSREDLSAGLVGQEVDGICGYAPASATAIVRHVLSYAAAHGRS